MHHSARCSTIRSRGTSSSTRRAKTGAASANSARPSGDMRRIGCSPRSVASSRPAAWKAEERVTNEPFPHSTSKRSSIRSITSQSGRVSSSAAKNVLPKSASTCRRCHSDEIATRSGAIGSGAATALMIDERAP